MCIAILGALLPDIAIDGSLVSGWVYKVLQGLLGAFLVAFILVDVFVSRLQGLDLKNPKIIGAVILILGVIAGKFSKHRTFTHSILGLFWFWTAAACLFNTDCSWFLVGYISHIFIDLFNYYPVMLGYPLIKDEGIALKCVKSGNEWDRIIGIMGYTLCCVNIIIFIITRVSIYMK